MAADRSVKIMLGILTVLAILAIASQASAVLAPLALALLVIAVAWPLQRRLQAFLPKLVALIVVVLATAAVFFVLALAMSWGFTRVARTFIIDQRYQAAYDAFVTWLDGYGLTIGGLWSDYFSASSLIRLLQQAATRINATMSLSVIALAYVILGLLEVDGMRRKLLDLGDRADFVLKACEGTAVKLRRYAIVRTWMSLATGVLFTFAAWVGGLPLPVEWGVIAFALNYIPFIGPFIAIVLPTFWAVTQYETWQAVIVLFVCLNVLQFSIGSYIEPRVAGNALSISPFLVLFSVFFWTFLWGVFGAFIGVPITIAILTFCEQGASTRWVAKLLSGPKTRAAETPTEEAHG
ncbi:MAG: AI-2E family transporter [Rhizobiales bacterium]|nr:AI-2E family transporter [Hyphomicrobiales bacterium]